LLIRPTRAIVRLTRHNNIKELLIYRKKPRNSRYNSKVENHNKVRVWYSKDSVLKDKDLQIKTSYRKKKETQAYQPIGK
jgi:hypothetical protein